MFSPIDQIVLSNMLSPQKEPRVKKNNKSPDKPDDIELTTKVFLEQLKLGSNEY